VSYTQAQVTALKNAVAAGVRTVTTDGHSVTYASTSEMLRVISVMEKELDASAGRKKSRLTYPTFERGI
jgi:hypothetical protein